jgi:putative transposase
VSLATPLPVERLCELAQVTRAGFYRWRASPPAVDDDMDLRNDIQGIALEFPCYGWRRVTAELRRQGWVVNHKRVRRIMREDNLLCLRKGKFVVMTTDSKHNRPIYPNLAATIELTGIDQLWVADITYIRLEIEFVYLAVVLDAFSRRVIGWALDRSLEDDLAIAALRVALRGRSPGPGLVHHSDRGVQYASQDYTDLLKERKIDISMSAKVNPLSKDKVSHSLRSQAVGPGPSYRTRREEHALPIVRDEFRPAIPQSGCAPAWPVSASPAPSA